MAVKFCDEGVPGKTHPVNNTRQHGVNNSELLSRDIRGVFQDLP